MNLDIKRALPSAEEIKKRLRFMEKGKVITLRFDRKKKENDHYGRDTIPRNWLPFS